MVGSSDIAHMAAHVPLLILSKKKIITSMVVEAAKNMKQKTIAFDCDGTLQDSNDQPRQEVIDMLEGYRKMGYSIVVWSGGGEGYARSVARRLKIENVDCHSKGVFQPDIAVDDQNVDLGIINFKV